MSVFVNTWNSGGLHRSWLVCATESCLLFSTKIRLLLSECVGNEWTLPKGGGSSRDREIQCRANFVFENWFAQKGKHSLRDTNMCTYSKVTRLFSKPSREARWKGSPVHGTLLSPPMLYLDLQSGLFLMEGKAPHHRYIRPLTGTVGNLLLCPFCVCAFMHTFEYS